jgi:hypothetical protein
MRRTVALVALGLTLLTAAACGDDTKDPTTAPTTAAPTSAAASANTDKACADFKALFATDRMTKVGVPIGELLAYRNAGDDARAKDAEEKVKAEFDKIRTEVTTIAAESGDADLKSRLDQVAAEIEKSKDLKFLDEVDKVDELEKPFTEMLTGWILPIATVCDLN